MNSVGKDMNFSENCSGERSGDLAAHLLFSLKFIHPFIRSIIHSTNTHKTIGMTWEEGCREKVVGI